MESLNMQLQPFFDWLLRTTLQASLLICLILLLQAVMRSRLGVRWHYCLWLLLLVRMAVPWMPESRVSLFNLLPQAMPQRQFEHANVQVGHESADSIAASTGTSESAPISMTAVAQAEPETTTITPQTSEEAEGPAKSTFPKFVAMLPLAWLAGALVLAIYVCASSLNFLRIVRLRRPVTDQKILDLLEDCKSQMEIRTILGVVATDKVKCPALFGFVRPRLLLPDGMIEALSEQELRYVFLHELAHLKRHDIYIGWLMSLLQVLHWFNPLVWLAFYRMRSDRELACDALVMARTQSDEPKSYGRIIVNLVERFSRPQRLPGMAGILETKAQLKRRVTMIARFKKNSYQWSPLAVMLIIILGCVSLPDAKRTKASGISAAKPLSGVAMRRVMGYTSGSVTVSPDGKYLCDVTWEDELYVRDLATGEKRVLFPAGGTVRRLAISPDSKMVAYRWSDREKRIGNLQVMGLDGSKRRALIASKRFPPNPEDWSPGGDKVLARRPALDWDIKTSPPPIEIIWVSAEDGAIHSVTTLPKGRRIGTGMVDLSPDGRYIAYDARDLGIGLEKRDIFLFDIEKSREVSLEHPADDRLLGWTPDGNYIFFISDRSGTWDAWLLRVIGGKPQGWPHVVYDNIGQVGPIGFTQDGAYYYKALWFSNNVYTATVDLRKGKVLSGPEPVQHGLGGCPAWSPDGKYLAYCVWHPDGFSRIHIRPLETGKERVIETDLPGGIRWLIWSPDGQSLLACRGSVYRIDAHTGKSNVLLRSEAGSTRRAELSPDEKTVFYTTYDGSLFAKDLETAREKKICELLQHRRAWHWACWRLSPDGKRLVVGTPGRDSPAQLRILSVEGEEVRDLVPENWEKICDVAWAPDGQSVLFIVQKNPTELWQISAEGGQPRKLLTTKYIFWGSLRVHPDGQHIAFHEESEISGSGVWVMENFLPTAIASAEK